MQYNIIIFSKVKSDQYHRGHQHRESECHCSSKINLFEAYYTFQIHISIMKFKLRISYTGALHWIYPCIDPWKECGDQCRLKNKTKILSKLHAMFSDWMHTHNCWFVDSTEWSKARNAIHYVSGNGWIEIKCWTARVPLTCIVTKANCTCLIRRYRIVLQLVFAII